MNSQPKEDTIPSFSTQLAQLLERAARNNFLIRLGAVVAALWVWLTLLRFTLGASNEASGLSTRYGGDLGSAIFGGSIALVAAIPAILVWVQLLRLTRVLSQLILRTLYWDTSSDGDDQAVQVHAVQELTENLIEIFLSWFRLFAITWIILIISKAIGAIVVLITILGPKNLY